ncbi:MAG: tail fiber domain-containing protein [Saprospiraceae bacterium]
MKKMHQLTLLSFLFLSMLCFTTVSFAQIHIDNDKDVAMGTTSTDNCKLRIYNNDGNNRYGLSITNDGSNANGVTGTRFGFYSGVRQDAGYTGDESTVGFQAIVHPYGTGQGFGVFSEIKGHGSGYKAAFFGKVTQPMSSGSNIFGTDLVVDNEGVGSAYGLRTQVTGGTGGALYGLENNVTGNVNSPGKIAGIRNITKLNGNNNKSAGIYNETTTGAQSSGKKFGIYNNLLVGNNTGGVGIRYAFYSELNGSPNSTAYAGYFSGNVHVTGDFTNPSDRRLKENIRDYKGGLELIKRLSPKTYAFKSNLSISLPKGKQYGLIAQDLENVLPALVKDTQHPTPITVKNVAQENSTEEDLEDVLGGSTSYKSVNYQALIPVLISAIQEQQAQIELQGKEIELLKKELSILKERR